MTQNLKKKTWALKSVIDFSELLNKEDKIIRRISNGEVALMNRNSEIEEIRRTNLLKKSKFVVLNKLFRRSFHKETTFESIKEESCEEEDVRLILQDDLTHNGDRIHGDTYTRDDSFIEDANSLSWLSRQDSENSLDGSMN